MKPKKTPTPQSPPPTWATGIYLGLGRGVAVPDKPQPGKVYRLIAPRGDACIAHGNTWAESIADE